MHVFARTCKIQYTGPMFVFPFTNPHPLPTPTEASKTPFSLSVLPVTRTLRQRNGLNPNGTANSRQTEPPKSDCRQTRRRKNGQRCRRRVCGGSRGQHLQHLQSAVTVRKHMHTGAVVHTCLHTGAFVRWLVRARLCWLGGEVEANRVRCVVSLEWRVVPMYTAFGGTR